MAFLKKGLIAHCAILLKLRGSEKFFWALMKWKHHQHHWKCNFENHAKMQKKTRFAAASLQSSILSHIANLLHLWNYLIFHDSQSIHKLFVLSFVMSVFLSLVISLLCCVPPKQGPPGSVFGTKRSVSTNPSNDSLKNRYKPHVALSYGSNFSTVTFPANTCIGWMGPSLENSIVWRASRENLILC